MLLTDGVYNCGSENDVISAAKELQSIADIYGMMIGISSEDDKTKLSKIITEPRKNHLFALSDLEQISRLVSDLRTLISRDRLKCGL